MCCLKDYLLWISRAISMVARFFYMGIGQDYVISAML